MLFGDPQKETVCLNEDTLWSGYPGKDDGVTDAWTHMQRARELVMAGERAQADAYIEEHLLGRYSESYLPAGTLHFTFPESSYSEYERNLDLERAIHHTAYVSGDALFWRETFISEPDQVMVMKFEATEPGHITFDVRIDSPLRFHTAGEAGDGRATLTLDGIAPSEDLPGYLEAPDPVRYEQEDARKGMRFGVLISLEAEGGSVCAATTESEAEERVPCIRVQKADRVEMRIYLRTSFRGYDRHPYLDGADCRSLLMDDDRRAAAFSYDELKKRHIADYRSLYSRVSLRFAGGPEEDELPVDERLRLFQETQDDPYLYSLLFQYGRYLTIAASRAGTRPMNLQGIWNDKIQPPWSSNYTTNINLEMNYWGAEAENLSELTGPLFDFIDILSETGAQTAQKFYHADGAVVHHNTDIWGMAHPVGIRHPQHNMNTCGFWNMAYGWLARHLCEHYAYTLDQEFLENRCYPVLKKAAQFFLDILTEDGEGNLVLPVSGSPENTFVQNGEKCHNTKYTTMSLAIVREVLGNFVRTVEILDRTDRQQEIPAYLSKERQKTMTDEIQERCDARDPLADRARKALARLAPYRIGSRGQLLEWDEEFEEDEIHHRHISHLYPLYPGREFRVDRSGMQEDGENRWIRACRRSLEERTDVGTGWSLGWKINIWARLGDGDRALSLLKRQLHLTQEQRTIAAEGEGAGTYPNLFDAHPPFQIDGNFAAAAGISEMLLQNEENRVILLPALPRELGNGQACGLRAWGAIQIDLFFADGRLLDARVYSKADQPRRIEFVYRGRSLVRTVEGRDVFRLTEKDFEGETKEE